MLSLAERSKLLVCCFSADFVAVSFNTVQPPDFLLRVTLGKTYTAYTAKKGACDWVPVASESAESRLKTWPSSIVIANTPPTLPRGQNDSCGGG